MKASFWLINLKIPNVLFSIRAATGQRISKLFSLFFIGVCLTGCIPVYKLTKEKMPNTFAVPRALQDGRVLEVLVWQSNDSNSVWQIKSQRDISARNFSVTVGDVPAGFEQIIPPPPIKPILLSGKEYLITVLVRKGKGANSLNFPCSTYWTVE
jgi:hypothetical protein